MNEKKPYLLVLRGLKVDGKKHECGVCNRKFSDVNILEAHLRTHTEDKPYKCEVREKSFSKTHNLRVRLCSYSTHERFHRKTGVTKFKSNLSLRLRHKINTGGRLYTCEVCEKKFTQFVALKEHRCKPKFWCLICDRSFYYSNAYQEHSCIEKQNIKRSSPVNDNDKVYRCEICEKPFQQKHLWQKHQSTHIVEDDGKVAYECKKCEANFNRPFLLKRHFCSQDKRDVRKEGFCSQEKRDEGGVCNKTKSSQVSSLRIRVRTHSGEKQYKCEVCEKNYNNLTDLKNHCVSHICTYVSVLKRFSTLFCQRDDECYVVLP